jgi:hypothetical protein
VNAAAQDLGLEPGLAAERDESALSVSPPQAGERTQEPRL